MTKKKTKGPPRPSTQAAKLLAQVLAKAAGVNLISWAMDVRRDLLILQVEGHGLGYYFTGRLKASVDHPDQAALAIAGSVAAWGLEQFFLATAAWAAGVGFRPGLQRAKIDVWAATLDREPVQVATGFTNRPHRAEEP